MCNIVIMMYYDDEFSLANGAQSERQITYAPCRPAVSMWQSGNTKDGVIIYATLSPANIFQHWVFFLSRHGWCLSQHSIPGHVFSEYN